MHKKREKFLHHRSSAIHTLTDNFLGTAFIKLIRYVHLASVFNVILIFLLWYLIGLISWLNYLFVLCIYSIILSFNFFAFGGYNHGPCGCEVGFVTLCLLLQLKIYYGPHYPLQECWMYCPGLFSAVTLCQIFFCSQCLSGRLLKESSVQYCCYFIRLI